MSGSLKRLLKACVRLDQSETLLGCCDQTRHVSLYLASLTVLTSDADSAHFSLAPPYQTTQLQKRKIGNQMQGETGNISLLLESGFSRDCDAWLNKSSRTERFKLKPEPVAQGPYQLWSNPEMEVKWAKQLSYKIRCAEHSDLPFLGSYAFGKGLLHLQRLDF